CSPPSALPAGLPSFSTRRSSDLDAPPCFGLVQAIERMASGHAGFAARAFIKIDLEGVLLARLRRAGGEKVDVNGCPGWQFAFFIDRKSTRLNSSHRTISYAVFCL